MSGEETTNKTKDAENANNKSTFILSPTVIAALITALCTLMGVVITAILNPDLWDHFPLFQPTITITSTFLPFETPTFGDETSTTIIDVETPSLTPTFYTMHASPTLVETPTSTPAEVMTVVLEPPSYSVKLGQHININARKSYVTFRDGSIYNCANYRLCAFSWTIFHRESGDSVFIADNDNGILSYTFPRKGNYIITAYVCRGVCGTGYASVAVR
jgi:hypothetical protein